MDHATLVNWSMDHLFKDRVVHGPLVNEPVGFFDNNLLTYVYITIRT
jgi:hypothetical protein